jgi:ubiquinone biosynthesis monooxygenase Coq7
MDNQNLHAMIRVNQAGEYGATRIYQGQMDAVGKSSPLFSELHHMLSQEKEHLKAFNERMVDTNIPPTLFHPLWHTAGYMLGYITGIMGEKAIHACTEAVEEVIDEHYQEQLSELENTPEHQELWEQINTFRQEELEHRDMARAQGASQAPFQPFLKMAIKSASKLAIFLSKRV